MPFLVNFILNNAPPLHRYEYPKAGTRVRLVRHLQTQYLRWHSLLGSCKCRVSTENELLLKDGPWASHMLHQRSGPDLPRHTHTYTFSFTHRRACTHTHTQSLFRASLVRQEPPLQSNLRIRNDSLPGLLIYLKFHY